MPLINLLPITSLFRARQDVYAVRWEKDGKSGYMPACKIDWEHYRTFKANGGLYKDYAKKELLPLNEEAIRRHLSGKETIGIYPLLEDNTSYFIAADFDEANWRDTIQRLYQSCTDFEIPAYMERSRSGNGGHLWIFFEENLPAEQTRQVMFELLKKSGILSPFEKEPSFDRLFPNQDAHSANGKAYGNLIALPLNGKSIQNGNSVFLDPETFEPFPDQWMERIQSFLKIPKSEIGQIGNQKCKVGKKITVAMIQSLARMEDIEKIANSFGTIIVDECHHIPAKSFREAIIRFHSYYLYGLTATPKRKNNDEKLIYVYIGNVLYQADPAASFLQNPDSFSEIHIRETNLFAPFDYKIDQYETISRILIHDTQRNALIVEDIEKHAGRFKTILVLTERKAHVDILNLYLKDKFETITLHGEDSERSRKSKLEQIKQGHYKIVISTGQFFGEGMDVDTLECLFIVYPFTFEGKLVQYIGRIQRSGKAPVIFDYRDSRIDYFEKMFKMRNRYYKRLRREEAR